MGLDDLSELNKGAGSPIHWNPYRNYSRYNLKNNNLLFSLKKFYEVWWLDKNPQTWDKIKEKNNEYEIERQN